MRRDVFQAIADPTRRNILQLIASTPMNVNSIAENFKMSRPAISQHVKILEECGLVEARTIGRERHCHATLSPLTAVQSWLHLIHIAPASPKSSKTSTPPKAPKASKATTAPKEPEPSLHSTVEAIKEKKSKKQERKAKKKEKKEGKKGKKGKKY